ncbi:unnamed protein product, partial [marine sediment metagenome]
LLSNVNINMILEPVTPPTPPVEYGTIAIPAILGIIVMLAVLRL